jgi:hypothetical protein
MGVVISISSWGFDLRHSIYVTGVSDLDLVWDPQVLLCFAHTPITIPTVSALKNYYTWSLLQVLTDFINHFWIQVAVSLLKPLCGGFRS